MEVEFCASRKVMLCLRHGDVFRPQGRNILEAICRDGKWRGIFIVFGYLLRLVTVKRSGKAQFW